MYKKIVTILIVIAMLLSINACKRQEDSADNHMNSTAGITEQITPGVTKPASPDNSDPSDPDSSEPTLPEGEGIEELPTDIIDPPTGENDGKEDPTDPSIAEGSGENNSTDPSTGVTDGKDNPTEPSTGNNDGNGDSTTGENHAPCCAYAEYLAMTPEAQQEYMKTFDSTMAFINWSRSGEAEHKEHNTSTEVEGGDFDVGDYID